MKSIDTQLLVAYSKAAVTAHQNGALQCYSGL